MRGLIVVSLLALAPTAWASAGPMDDKDLQELATLIVHGQITDVICLSEPEFDGTKTYTPYWATLTIDDVQKGDDVDSVTLPFSTLDYEPGAALPKCDWAPYYETGYKGLFYLMTGASTDLYTLVGDGAYVPDADSAGQGLPSCLMTDSDVVESEDVLAPEQDASEGDSAEVGPSSDISEGLDASADIVEGPEPDGSEASDTSTVVAPDAAGMEFDAGPGYAPHRPDCFSDNDCDEGEECVGNSNGDAFCEEPCTSDGDCSSGDVCVINAWGNGYCEWGGPSADPEAAESSEASGGDDGCAGGGSTTPIPVVLLLMGAWVTSIRRRCGALS